MAEAPISFGPLAERRREQLGLSRADLESAYRGSGTDVDGREYVRKYRQLPDGRRILLDCSYGPDDYIVKFRIIDDAER